MNILLVRRSAMVAAFLAFALLSLTSPLSAQFGPAAVAPESAVNIPESQLLKPEALLRLLKSSGADKPLVLQVGSRMLFAQGHIAGSEYAGPGSQPAGIQLLESRVKSLPRTKLIVLYCGCCPWVRCPNLEPAFAKLREMGFTNVKALYLAQDFGADWADKGYPVERGQ
jgi:rhodanese-related sulfurtransferase